MTSSVAGQRRSSKALPKAKFAPMTRHGHCLVVCYQSDPLRLSESQQNHYIWEVCSANWWAALKTARPAVSINQQKGPNSSVWQCPIAHHTTNASKVERIGLWSFALLAIFIWSLANWLPLQVSQQHLQGKHFHNEQEAENAFQQFTESWSTEFYTTGISKHFSLAKMCWL